MILIDVVIIVGGVDSHGSLFTESLYQYLGQLNYSNACLSAVSRMHR